MRIPAPVGELKDEEDQAVTDQLSLLPDEPRKPRSTWITRFESALAHHIGMPPNRGRLMAELGTIRKHTGDDLDEIYRHFRIFLRNTPSEFASPTYFRTSYKRWTREGLATWKRGRELDREHEQRKREHLAAPRGATTDPEAIGSLLADLKRHGRQVPEWLRRADRSKDARLLGRSETE